MIFILIFFLSVSFSATIYSQFNPGAKQIALSNSDIALSNDVFALFNNPAGLAQLNWRELGIYYSPAPFGFKELSNGFFAYHEPLSFGSVAAGGMIYGFELYKETKLLLSYSHRFEKLLAGIVFNYHTVSIKNYGFDGVFYLNLGALTYITDRLRWGFSFQNINRASFGNSKDQIPVILTTGFSYNILNNFSFNFSFEKDLKYNSTLSAGIDYNIIEYISLRSGFANEPDKYSAGIGINYSFISLDYAFFTHTDLGLTHQAGLIFSFGETGSRYEKIREFLNLK